MGNQPREPMTKPDEVMAWAEETKKANGEAFTMLKKEEQLLIANLILAMRDHIKSLQSNEENCDRSPEPTDECSRTPEEPTEKESAPEIIQRQSGDVYGKQTNMEYFKANNVNMQSAYNIFQRWQDCDPSNRMIMDEKRKAYINSAAFAFWLNLPHE